MRWPAAVHAASIASPVAAAAAAIAIATAAAAAQPSAAITPSSTTLATSPATGRPVSSRLPAVALVDHIALTVVAFHVLRVWVQLRPTLSEPDVLFEQPVERTLVSVYRLSRVPHAHHCSRLA